MYENEKGPYFYVIYALRECPDGPVFYVGKTSGRARSAKDIMRGRLSAHMGSVHSGCTPCSEHIRQLRARRVYPIIEMVEQHYPFALPALGNKCHSEAYWIKTFLEYGHPLKNVVHGAPEMRGTFFHPPRGWWLPPKAAAITTPAVPPPVNSIFDRDPGPLPPWDEIFPNLPESSSGPSIFDP